jgi:hypothetical protein
VEQGRGVQRDALEPSARALEAAAAAGTAPFGLRATRRMLPAVRDWLSSTTWSEP